MEDRVLTIADLIRVCEEQKVYTYSSKETGKPVVVQSIQDFSSTDIEESDDGKLYAKVRVCHTLLNRNGSYITEDSMKAAMPTLKYSPLLANIHQLDDGSWDFHAHDSHIEKDDNGNEYRVYDESQIGTFTADDPYLEYDEEMDKTYVVAKVAIPTEYTRAADIIKDKGGTRVSCELLIYDYTYNAKKKYLQLNDFRFSGVACLGSEKNGEPILEGMEGSKLTLEDFSEDKNSIVKYAAQMKEFQDRLSQLESTLLNQKGNPKEGGNPNLLNELLSKYGKTVEELDFDYEAMTDEELSAKFAELFDTPEPANDPEPEKFEKLVRTYEISHEDIRYALYQLLTSYEEADNEWYFINSVYDDHFTYENWSGDKIFGQSYTKDGDNVAFDGERYNLHRELLTDSEYAELQTMRAEYAGLVEYKNNAEFAKLHSQREAILNDEKYSILAEVDDFKSLTENMDNYSLEDLTKEVKVIFADYIASVGHYSYSPKVPKRITVGGADPDSHVDDSKPYGGILDD